MWWYNKTGTQGGSCVTAHKELCGSFDLAIDGKSISQLNVFAEGGIDCAEFHSVPSHVH